MAEVPVPIPMDIITTMILPKLPPKSIARFKYVSKSWNSFLKTPLFIALHLTHSLSSHRRLCILNYGTHLDSTPFMSSGLGSHFDTTSTSRFDIPTSFSGRAISVVGSLHGLVALLFKNVGNPNPNLNPPLLDLILWNPCTNSHLLLPPHSLENGDNRDQRTLLRVGIVLGVSFGFGYDHFKDDYKIIKLVDRFVPTHHGEINDDSIIHREVWVYSMRNNCWEGVQVSFPGDRIEWSCPGAVINNHLLHWIFWNSEEKKPIIRAFDLVTLDWTRLGLPNFPISEEGFELEISDFLGLGVVDGCLGLVARICPKFDNAYVWVMKEYGVKESWTVLFNVVEAGIVGPLSGVPLGCSEGGDEVLVLVRKADDEDVRVCLYDMRKKTLKDARLKVPSNNLKLRDVNFCAESLAPVAEMIHR